HLLFHLACRDSISCRTDRERRGFWNDREFCSEQDSPSSESQAMKHAITKTDCPERLQYTKYYEHDGMLRAYANRAMVMAFLFAGIATASLGFAIYVRVQPPTIIRVV